MATKQRPATLQRFDARPLFGQVRSSLIQLLADLTPAETPLEKMLWDSPTPAGDWLVRDIVAHLVGNDLGRCPDPETLTRGRDQDRARPCRRSWTGTMITGFEPGSASARTSCRTFSR